jgi:hypothetical protein
MKLYACRCGCATPVMLYRRAEGPEGQVIRSADFYIRKASEAGVRWARPCQCSDDYPVCPGCGRRVAPGAQYVVEVQGAGIPATESAALAFSLFAKREAQRV